MTLKLNGSSSGSVSLDAPASTTSGADITFKLPVADGTSGQALTTNASGQLQFASTGAILQVVNTLVTTNHDIAMGTADTWYTLTNMDTAITPTSTSSKILISGTIYGEHSCYEHGITWRLARTISGGSLTPIGINTESSPGSRRICTGGWQHGGSDYDSTPAPINLTNYVDSPSTTTATTYHLQLTHYSAGSGNFNLNHTVSDSDSDGYERGASWITLMEIAG